MGQGDASIRRELRGVACHWNANVLAAGVNLLTENIFSMIVFKGEST